MSSDWPPSKQWLADALEGGEITQEQFDVMSNTLRPDQAVRLLRAKVGELEGQVKDAVEFHGGLRPIDEVKADIALIAHLLADLYERVGWATDVEVKAQ
jgi:hypothetical protein